MDTCRENEGNDLSKDEDKMKQKFAEIYEFKKKYSLHDLSKALGDTLDFNLLIKNGKPDTENASSVKAFNHNMEKLAIMLELVKFSEKPNYKKLMQCLAKARGIIIDM